jgi:transposase-like protein
MKRNCPQKNCKSSYIVKDGFYRRKNDSRKIQRFKCSICKSKFSASTGTLEFGQKKRRVNFLLFKLFCAKVSQRRAAKIVGVNKITVARKFDYWAKKSKQKNKKFKKLLKNNKVKHIQFDDLITKEKTKLKPLSVSIAVDAKKRYILGTKVSKIPSFGRLAKKSLNKYGYRPSEHRVQLENLFQELTEIVDPNAIIESDSHNEYSCIVDKYFNNADYKQYLGMESCITGQGELKKNIFDPLFTINHTLAIMRDSISTLVRRTWCTTQEIQKLEGHLDIFVYYYNFYYLGYKSPR